MSELTVTVLQLHVREGCEEEFARAFRDNDAVALSLGKHTNRHRLYTFVLAGIIYGAAAPMYLWYLRTATPSVFTAEVTFVTWTALVIGGIASKSGPIIGAVILLLVTESVSLTSVPLAVAPLAVAVLTIWPASTSSWVTT